MIILTRCYYFSAAHRLYIKDLEDEENHKIFGKCSNLKGHGHNYRVEITVGGEVDKESGLLCNLTQLDSVVLNVIKRFDRCRLDTDISYFFDKQTTGENISRYLWETLVDKLDREILKVVVWETENSYFSISKEEKR